MAPAAKSEALKRKRSTTASQDAKKRRRDVEKTVDAEAQILQLEAQILESKKNYNNITALFDYIEGYQDNLDNAMYAVRACCAVFIKLGAAGKLMARSGLSDKDQVVVQWLKEKYFQFRKMLLDLFEVEDVAEAALKFSMTLVKTETKHLSDRQEYLFPTFFTTDIVRALVEKASKEVRATFVDEFIDEFDDVRFYTFRGIKSLTSEWTKPSETLFNAAFELLSAIEDVPESNDDLDTFFIGKPAKSNHDVLNFNKHKREAHEAWQALMAHGTTKDRRKKILTALVEVIAPWFAKPELLSDFLTDCYGMGGATSLLALSGVFYLIEQRNLDYPSFYTKLYSLLDRDILHSKHRSRFFRLMNTFLSSSHLPAALVASFIKRLARLSLSAPPSAIVFVVPWAYNMFRMHPLCTFMLHREIREPEVRRMIETRGFTDPFIEDESDPMETRAIDSCLWEIVQLQSHYHPNVGTITKIISEQFTKQSYNLEDFLDHSYSSLLDAEMSKQVKKAPVVEFQIPKKIFLPQEADSEVPDSLVVKLWDF